MSKVQILKGDVGKSITVDAICRGNGFCFAYCEDRITVSSCYLDCSTSSITDLISGIQEWFKVEVTVPYDFFVIYTNQFESDLKELFDWLKDNENIIDSRIVIVTCK